MKPFSIYHFCLTREFLGTIRNDEVAKPWSTKYNIYICCNGEKALKQYYQLDPGHESVSQHL